MVILILGWIAVAACGAVILTILGLYCRARSLSNGIMTFASNEFHDAANSLMKTPEEVPDSVLEALERMNKLAQAPRASYGLLYAMKSRKENSDSINDDTFGKDFDGMRPELKDLFSKAVTGWLNYVSHQNVFNNLRITLAIMRLKSQGLHSSEAEEQVGFKFLSRHASGAH